ncbi:hypothetical protein Thiosp_01425 [Thiorhodovibrio litoralis]|nr:hypothetical protein Thiosp_01425 [Thiorhodovibrio litoralis]
MRNLTWAAGVNQVSRIKDQGRYLYGSAQRLPGGSGFPLTMAWGKD